MGAWSQAAYIAAEDSAKQMWVLTNPNPLFTYIKFFIIPFIAIYWMLN